MSERRRGESFEDHAIVLGYVPLKESDRLVSLLTLEHGRIAAVARGAAKSIKRFGAALDPATYGKAQLQLAKGQSAEGALWILLGMEAKSSFLHFRKEYVGLESAFFALRLVADMVPEGVSDVGLFKALGRYLRDSETLPFARCAGWARASFWIWFAHHLGYGNFEELLQHKWDDAAFAPIQGAFQKGLQPEDPDFVNVFKVLAVLAGQSDFRDLNLSDEAALYKRWVEVSGIHWDHFEKWLSSKKTV